jgi:NitT/TauT family transport system ATP-binding protein
LAVWLKRCRVRILFEDVTKQYPHRLTDLVAVQNFTLEIDANRFTALVGPSGCGKSTVINMAAGFINPDSGQISCNGDQVLAPARSRAVVFQEDALFPWFTVEQNIGYGPRMARLSRDIVQSLIDKYLTVVGLNDARYYYPKQLSGGMKKRVDLARVYAAGAPILLMDEPFGSLDSFGRRKMQESLSLLWEAERKTVLFVTHDLEEAIFLADEVVVMTKSPGTVKSRTEVSFPRPRIPVITRDPRFLNLRYGLEEEIASA